MKKFLLGILVGFLLAGMAAVVLFFVMVRLGRRPPDIPAASVLVLRIEGEMPETPPVEIPIPFFERARPLTVKDYWELLRMAAADSRIKAVLLVPENVGAGWAKLQQVRESLEQYRRSGKPLFAALRAPGAREYYLAAGAERVYMSPEDFLDLKGLRVELMYLKQTLDKIGVQVEVASAGKYKDAPDALTRTSASPETREVMNSILDEVYGNIVEAIAAGRKQSPEQVRTTIDQGPFISSQALERRLVDGLLYEDQILGELEKRAKTSGLKRLDARTYRRVPAGSLGLEGSRRIALVFAEGAIVRGDGESPFGGEGLIKAGEFIRLLRRVADDRQVRGVIVRIDSPGGDGFASDEILREMMLLRQKKPLVISMSDAAASGGYYIAMTGDPVVAYPGTYTGSIGVFYGKANLRGLYDKLGINKEILQRGRNAAIDSDYVPLSPEARAKLQSAIQEFYKGFVRRVADGRNRKYEDVAPLAEGRVWLGSQAKRNGLVDYLGGLDRAIELVKQKAGIPAQEKIRLVTYPAPRTIFDQLLGGRETRLDPALAAFLRRYATKTWRDGGVFRLMPYSIDVR